MTLEDIRKKIDEIDSKIIDLLEKRIELAIETKQFKGQFQDEKREKEILSKISNPCIREIYKTIFKNIKKIVKTLYQNK